MDLIPWLLTSLAYVVGLIWSLIWFLISGWVSTLLQIAVLIAVIYWLKYGWQRAPYEVWKRTRSFGWFFWSWIRGRDPEPRAHDEVVRLVKLREFGDINVSTLLSLAALVGLLLVAPFDEVSPAPPAVRCWPSDLTPEQTIAQLAATARSAISARRTSRWPSRDQAPTSASV